MDIFVIKLDSLNNVPIEMVKEFQKKEISNPKKLLEHCFSYLMIDRILREFYQLEDREIVFEKKKPILKSGKKFFSLSHSNEYIALVFSDSPCGIDIEKNTERDFAKLAKRMNFKNNSSLGFYQEWTKFEAEYKLGTSSKTLWTTQFEDYSITAVSSIEENVELYIQSN